MKRDLYYDLLDVLTWSKIAFEGPLGPNTRFSFRMSLELKRVIRRLERAQYMRKRRQARVIRVIRSSVVVQPGRRSITLDE